MNEHTKTRNNLAKRLVCVELEKVSETKLKGWAEAEKERRRFHLKSIHKINIKMTKKIESESLQVIFERWSSMRLDIFLKGETLERIESSSHHKVQPELKKPIYYYGVRHKLKLHQNGLNLPNEKNRILEQFSSHTKLASTPGTMRNENYPNLFSYKASLSLSVLPVFVSNVQCIHTSKELEKTSREWITLHLYTENRTQKWI